MARARRPLGLAFSALSAASASVLLFSDCGREAPAFEVNRERAPEMEAVEPLAPEDDPKAIAADVTAALAGEARVQAPPRAQAPPVVEAPVDSAPAETAGAAGSALPGAYDDAWQPTDFGGYYIAPKVIAGDTVDIVFHFHAGRAAAKEYRAQGHGAVIVALTYGVGSKAYSDALANPDRFQKMLGEMEDRLRKAKGNPRIRIRRISLFAWSAGYAAIRNILAQGYYDRVDTVVLLDGLHTNYLPPEPMTLKRRPDGSSLDVFMRFAQDAAEGKKELVFTHSSIVPPGYASTTETANMLIDVVKAKKVWLHTPGPRGLWRNYRADVGGFHVRGFSGTNKGAHIAQLHLVGEVLRDLVVPRWVRIDQPARGAARPITVTKIRSPYGSIFPRASGRSSR